MHGNGEGVEANRRDSDGDNEGGEDNRERMAMITNSPRARQDFICGMARRRPLHPKSKFSNLGRLYS